MRFANLVADLKRPRTDSSQEPQLDVAVRSASDAGLSMSEVATAKNLMIRRRHRRQSLVRFEPDEDSTEDANLALSRLDKPLWLEAYTSLPVSETKHLPIQALTAREVFSDVLIRVDEKRTEMERKQRAFVRKNGERVPIRRFMDSISRYVKKFQDIGDVVVQYDPVHAALPWAGVRVLLQLAIGDSQVYGAMLEGLEYASYVISTYSENAIYAMLGDFAAIEQMQTSLVRLYATVLKYLNKAYQYYSQHSTERTLKGAFTAPANSIEALVATIRREEERVYRALDLLQTENLKRGMANQMDELALDIRGVRNILLDPPKSLEQLRDNFFKWIKPTFTDDELDLATRKRLDGTCGWVLMNDSFKDWLSPWAGTGDARSRILWIHSPPGFGKTVLSSRLVQHLQTDENHDVAFFYCTSDDESKNNPYAILRSWIAQMIKKSDQALSAVRDTFEQHQERTPTRSELWSLFKTAIKIVPRVSLVIDGFDECQHTDQPSKDQTEDVRARFLQELMQNLVTPTRILMTSREELVFRNVLSDAAEQGPIDFTEHRITPADNQTDIRMVSSHLVGQKLGKKPQQLREDIAERAAENSNGMFLMINWLSTKLKPSRNEKALRAAVEEMPTGMGDVYQPTIDKLNVLDKEDRDQVLVKLRLLVYAVRPLTVKELIEAMAVATNDGDEYPADLLPDSWTLGYLDEAQATELLLEHCSSLIEVRGSEEDFGLRTVHFVHFTVKEFLLKNPILNDIDKTGGSGHEWLTALCLRYLCYEPFSDIEPDTPDVYTALTNYPFFHYAASSWVAHMLELHPPSEEVFEVALTLFDPSTKNWSLWRSMVDVLSFNIPSDEDFDMEIQNRAEWQRFPPEITSQREIEVIHGSTIYMAAVHGLTDLVERLSSTDHDPQIVGGRFGFPLQGAVAHDRVETAMCLIKAGADVNQPGGEYGSALNAACARASEELVLRLLELRADPKASSPGGRSALHFACHSGSLPIVKHLLASGADFDAASNNGETPIARACASSELEIVKFLLEKYSGQIPCHRGGWDLLRIAIVHKHDALVKYLVDLGADVNYDESSKTDLTPLHTAANVSTPEIVQLLLENGATESINRVSPKEGGGTALALAVAYNSNPIEVSKTLIRYGARINETSQDGFTPLHLALSDVSYGRSTESWLDVIKFCIAEGAHTKAKTVSGETALQYMVRASDSWTMDMLRTLIRENPDLKDSELSAEWSLISCVISRDSSTKWCESIEEFLQNGADINFGTEDATPPIHTLALASEPDLERLRALLDWGADINLRWRNQTALHFASNGGHLEMVKELITRGADLNVCDEHRSTPLHDAIYRGHVEVVKVLLGAGASMEAPEPRSFDALSASLHSQIEEIEIFRLLATHTRDIRKFDGEGDSAITEILMHGIKKPKAKHADVLIEHGAFIPKDHIIKLERHGSDLKILVELQKHAFHGRAEQFDSLYPQEGLDDIGMTLGALLLAAAAGGEPKIAERILNDGADVECEILSGRTPLQLAVTSGSLSMTRLLLDRGANPHTKDLVGTNVLQQASRAQGQDVEIIHALIDSEAMADKTKLANNDEPWNMLVGAWVGETYSTERPLNPSVTQQLGFVVTTAGLLPGRDTWRFEGKGEGEGDSFSMVGQMLADHQLRFARVCEKLQGALHLAELDVSTGTIRGSYGVNENIVDGTFVVKKLT